jgi:hypothetical protein
MVSFNFESVEDFVDVSGCCSSEIVDEGVGIVAHEIRGNSTHNIPSTTEAKNFWAFDAVGLINNPHFDCGLAGIARHSFPSIWDVK